jgi:DNA-binding transcriptional MocR family regulator
MAKQLEKIEPHLYEQVVDRMSRLINQGTVRPGERIPSIRKLSSKMQVSISTVLQAYLVLESRGIIEARPQSGFYVRYPRELPSEPRISKPYPAATLVGVSDLVTKIFKAARNPNVVQLGTTAPSPALLPIRELARITASIVKQFSLSAASYDFPPGNEDLRREIAKRSLDWGGSLSAEDIVTTNGAMEGLNVCLRAVAKPEDVIVIESPTFYGVLQSIESLGMKALELPTHPREGISLTDLEQVLKTISVKACLLAPNFNNPLGSCMSERNKKRLVEMLAKKRIPLIEDDIYGDVYFGSIRPKAAKAFDSEGLVLLCSSFSKTIAPGYRLGWVAPGRFKSRVESLKFMNTMANASLPQMAIAKFLEGGSYDRHLRRLRRAFATHVQLMTMGIGQYFPNGTRVTRPTGGFSLWVELPRGVDSLDLHREALNEKISIAPGPIFSAKGKYGNFIRLSCGQAWSPRLEQSLMTLGRLAAKK